MLGILCELYNDSKKLKSISVKENKYHRTSVNDSLIEQLPSIDELIKKSNLPRKRISYHSPFINRQVERVI